MGKSRVILMFMLMFTMVVVTACGADSEQNTEGDQTSHESNGEQSNDGSEANGSFNEPVSLTWASGSLGGGWYSMAGGISTLIHEHQSNISISVIPGGSLQNIPFIHQNEAQIAWLQPAFVLAGVQGEDPFEEAYPDVLAIGNGFGLNYFHFAVGADTEFNSIDEIFENKMPIRIAVTPVNNSDEWVFRKFLEYYGVTYDDIRSWGGDIFHASYNEQASMFKDGNVDAIFSQLAIPGAAITEASIGREMKILPMSDGLMEHLEQYTLKKGVLPARTYPEVVNGNEDIPTATMGNILVVNRDVPEEIVYEITKIINENIDRLPGIHASLEDYNIEEATLNLGTELHPGAERYYREAGILQ